MSIFLSQRRGLLRRLAGAGLLMLTAAAGSALRAQPTSPAVIVTITLDDAQLARGRTTTLHVFARVRPELAAAADRIFAWALNFRDSDGLIAVPDFARLVTPTSDNDPVFSSTGVADGPDLFGIRDTFMNRPAAGVAEPVELFSVPVQALATGKAMFTAEPGSGPLFTTDFVVAPLEGDDPWLGGDYAQAVAELVVLSGLDELPPFPVSVVPGETPGQMILSFPVQNGFDYTVEGLGSLGGPVWIALPGAPHNTGRLVVSTASPVRRFFRVRVEAR